MAVIDLRVPLAPPDSPRRQQSLLGCAKAGEVPAFAFHSIDPVLFQAQLS